MLDNLNLTKINRNESASAAHDKLITACLVALINTNVQRLWLAIIVVIVPHEPYAGATD